MDFFVYNSDSNFASSELMGVFYYGNVIQIDMYTHVLAAVDV